VKTRLSDTSSVYVEGALPEWRVPERTHSHTGINLTTKEHWNFGGSGEFGKLRDSQTGAETDRKAAGIRMGYGVSKMQFSSAIEYRRDKRGTTRPGAYRNDYMAVS